MMKGGGLLRFLVCITFAEMNGDGSTVNLSMERKMCCATSLRGEALFMAGVYGYSCGNGSLYMHDYGCIAHTHVEALSGDGPM